MKTTLPSHRCYSCQFFKAAVLPRETEQTGSRIWIYGKTDFKELVQVKTSKSKICRAGWRPREELILQLKIKGSQEAKLFLRDLSDL